MVRSTAKNIKHTARAQSPQKGQDMYKGYDIEFNFYGQKEYSVQYCGDDVIFSTEEEAKRFIDEITA